MKAGPFCFYRFSGLIGDPDLRGTTAQILRSRLATALGAPPDMPAPRELPLAENSYFEACKSCFRSSLATMLIRKCCSRVNPAD